MQKTIYSKSSIERKNEYKIITRIYEEDGVRKVEKAAPNCKDESLYDRKGNACTV